MVRSIFLMLCLSLCSSAFATDAQTALSLINNMDSRIQILEDMRYNIIYSEDGYVALSAYYQDLELLTCSDWCRLDKQEFMSEAGSFLYSVSYDLYFTLPNAISDMQSYKSQMVTAFLAMNYNQVAALYLEAQNGTFYPSLAGGDVILDGIDATWAAIEQIIQWDNNNTLCNC